MAARMEAPVYAAPRMISKARPSESRGSPFADCPHALHGSGQQPTKPMTVPSFWSLQLSRSRAPQRPFQLRMNTNSHGCGVTRKRTAILVNGCSSVFLISLLGLACPSPTLHDLVAVDRPSHLSFGLRPRPPCENSRNPRLFLAHRLRRFPRTKERSGGERGLSTLNPPSMLVSTLGKATGRCIWPKSA